jgi:hypothetical protein
MDRRPKSRPEGRLPARRDGRVFWGISQKDPIAHDRAGSKAEALAQPALNDGRGPWPMRALIEATPRELVTRSDVAYLPKLDRWVTRRVALAGDAAHAMQENCLSRADTWTSTTVCAQRPGDAAHRRLVAADLRTSRVSGWHRAVGTAGLHHPGRSAERLQQPTGGRAGGAAPIAWISDRVLLAEARGERGASGPD